LARVVGRREVRAMEREKRGTDRVKARSDSIVAVDDMNRIRGCVGRRELRRRKRRGRAQPMMLAPRPTLFFFGTAQVWPADLPNTFLSDSIKGLINYLRFGTI
jgi:hypothetical protein